MKNRAKCKLCNSIIESFFQGDTVFCKCGEIAVIDGPAMRMYPIGSLNFLRVDDEGNEIVVKYKSDEEIKENAQSTEESPEKLSKNKILEELKAIINTYENLPQHAMISPINHYDLLNCMLLIYAILREE